MAIGYGVKITKDGKNLHNQMNKNSQKGSSPINMVDAVKKSGGWPNGKNTVEKVRIKRHTDC